VTDSPHLWKIDAQQRGPLLQFMLDGLRDAGCRLLSVAQPDRAPFRFAFETPTGERMGVVAYAFLANSKVTLNRPRDEHRFQVKYGSKDGHLHELWQDPFGLYTTLFLGIDPDRGFFVAADPVLHSPTRFFISVEFKRRHVDAILDSGWYAWERDVRRSTESDNPVEVLVGGRRDSFLRLVQFERDALGEDPGHRHWLAERSATDTMIARTAAAPPKLVAQVAAPALRHTLASEFQLSEDEVMTLIARTPRLKMAVRGWVAEEHLLRSLRAVEGVSDCERILAEGGADIRLRYKASDPLTIECKNVLRERTADGLARVDFQRTRASVGDPCSRYYSVTDFDVVAACLHAVSERWEFRFSPTASLAPHHRCPGRLSNLVRVDGRFGEDPGPVLTAAALTRTA
jgi:hypothetical protein